MSRLLAGLAVVVVLAGCSTSAEPPAAEVCRPVADTYVGDGDPAGYPCGLHPEDGSR